MSRRKKRSRYTVADMDAAHQLGAIAQDAIEAARERAPDQHERATRLFRAIYGPLGGRSVMSSKPGINSTPDGLG